MKMKGGKHSRNFDPDDNLDDSSNIEFDDEVDNHEIEEEEEEFEDEEEEDMDNSLATMNAKDSKMRKTYQFNNDNNNSLKSDNNPYNKINMGLNLPNSKQPLFI